MGAVRQCHCIGKLCTQQQLEAACLADCLSLKSVMMQNRLFMLRNWLPDQCCCCCS